MQFLKVNFSRTTNVLRTVLSKSSQIQQKRGKVTLHKSGLTRAGAIPLSQNFQGNLPSWLHNFDAMSTEDCASLFQTFPTVVHEMGTLPIGSPMPLASERMQGLLNHAVFYNPVTASEFFIANKFYAARKQKLSAENGKDGKPMDQNRANILAWILELYIRAVLIFDDVMDGTETRNNHAAWHTLPGVGMHAVNDIALLYTSLYLLLKNHFGQEEYYAALVETVLDCVYAVQLAESNLNMIKPGSSSQAGHSFEQVTIGKLYLNGSCTNLPVAAAMVVNDENDPELLHMANEIGFEITHHITLIDDWLDCYGDVNVRERLEATDISRGKNTWLVWKALELANEEQRHRLMECYGKNDEACVKEVKEIYHELDIKNVIIDVAEDMAQKLEKKVSQLPQRDLPCAIYLGMLKHARDMAQGKVSRF